MPFFVCSGAKETAIEHAIFPHGGGFTEMAPCPARDICAWYAAHDLGGLVAFNEQPREALLAAPFTSRPFSCPHFFEHAKLRKR